MKKTFLTILSIGSIAIAQGQALLDNLTLNAYSGETNIRAFKTVTLGNGFHIPVQAAGKTVTISISDISRPSINQNYVLASVPREAIKTMVEMKDRSVGQVNQTIQYFDGHGRLIQAVQWQGSPSKEDLVQYIEYDNSGRESKRFLPYAERLGADGSYKPAAATTQGDYYKVGGGWDSYVMKTAAPYEQTVFENSALNRIIEQGAPGIAWQPAAKRDSLGRTVVLEYSTNAGNDVRLWKVDASGASGTSYYLAGTLNKTVSKDENWVNTNVANLPSKSGTVEEYSDLQGRMLLKRVWQSETIKLETYYVYDNTGALRYVIPPAVRSTGFTAQTTDANFENYIYAYRYDKRQRLVEKKLPGRGWEWIVYNRNNLPILTQDAVQRGKAPSEWGYLKYDAFGRVTETGILTASYTTQLAAQNAADNHASSSGKHWEERTVVVGSFSGKDYTSYTQQAFPVTGLSPRLVNYYDDHYFEGANTSGLEFSGSGYLAANASLQTGTKVYKDDGSAPLLTVYYFDERGQVVQRAAQNHLGGTDRETNTYNFVGELLSNIHNHTVGGKTTIVTATNEYDHVGRLLTSRHKINAQAEVILVKNEYNEIGQLRQKRQHSENGGTNYLNIIDYKYNERGWLRSSSSPLFSYGLNYNVNSAGALLGNAQFNSNIAQQLWGHGTTTMANMFTYSYDYLNRLKNGSSTGTVMSEDVSYDDMGNIINLKRNGHAIGTTYSYNGNKLKSLSGQISTSSDYVYDLNGNVTKDYQGMVYGYNYMNLPKGASLGGTSVTYLYDATGTKLRKTATVGAITTVRDYVEGFEYNKVNGVNVIDMIHTSEGYLQNSNGTYSYHYNLTDHLGNVRATVQRSSATTGVVIQKHDYYAFGEPKAILISGNNNYLYNGKEYQGELGGQYDYGARFYDGEIARWNVMDPLSENHYDTSPYAYALNNPSTYIDLFGLDTLNNNNNFNSGDWNKFNPKKDVIGLNEVTVTAPRQVSGLEQAFNAFRDWGSDHPYFGSRPYDPVVYYRTINAARDPAVDLMNFASIASGVGDGYFLARGIYTGLRMGIPMVAARFAIRSLAKEVPLMPGAMRLAAEGGELGVINVANTSANLVEQAAVHGNSLKSLKPTWGYKLYSADGTFLKNGITSALKAESRYTKSFMSDKYMEKILFPNRKAAYEWEFIQNQVLKGPLNKNMH
ncbi:DUF6443 domain-containing protein [Sphingobacterium sp. UME9]|uniref:DUF6443 domain-containing protein n=1 Tax=Sphingobacterium sp. UME9 TaxID=1862316 RepID=UPI0016004621|nr:DUF6443 domain-containing protein [Sphingobacterium sp. UME9]MBB1646775.1 hypothetical protein [Sphingobacterium sp. UME9]